MDTFAGPLRTCMRSSFDRNIIDMPGRIFGRQRKEWMENRIHRQSICVLSTESIIIDMTGRAVSSAQILVSLDDDGRSCDEDEDGWKWIDGIYV